ncbi:MAG: proline--tRNA ligase [Clostridiaceae bacterium]|nr:proline--tRNA ligase [Clostridiaceae bacterium]
MKMSNMLLPTIRELPSDAEAQSHILMLRAALVRQVSSGIYSFLPLGYRVLRKIEQIVREEMDRAGALEVHMPALIESDLYKKSGRWDIYGADMFRLKDRSDRDFLLGPTHEEVFTDLVRWWLKSYKQLPITLYQIQNKYRDEKRPRYGLIRCKEFLMKDAYSYDATLESLDESYRKMKDAYYRIFERLGLKFLCVDADNGAMGGSGSQEFMVPSAIGEDDVVYCDACHYAANMEKAAFKASLAPAPEEMLPLRRIPTPGAHTIAQITEFLHCTPERVAKTLIYLADGKPVAVMLRGDRDLNEVKFKNHLGCRELEMADPATVEAVTHAVVGFAGPVGLAVPVYADAEIEGMRNLVVGGNETDVHIENCNLSRDFTVVDYADLRCAVEGDACPVCGKPMKIERGIEIGHIFKLGKRYTEVLDCEYTDEEGRPAIPYMGCYGIGVSRVIAAVIEQNCDEMGIIWPKSCAPYDVHLVALGRPGSAEEEAANKLYGDMVAAGLEVLYDDRNERAGVKFMDADLIGLPLRVTVGRKAKDGLVEVKERRGGDVREMSFEDVIAFAKA